MDDPTTLIILLAVYIYRRRQLQLLQRRRRRRHYQQQLRIRYRPAFEYVFRSFSLDLMPPGRARIYLRFTVPEIQRLAPLLRLYAIEYRAGIKCDSTTALCVICVRLSYPSRWPTLCDLFGRSPTWLSIVFNDSIQYLRHRFAGHLSWHRQLDDYTRLQEFADGVIHAGGVEDIWGFVDGTFRGHCRPSGQEAQRMVYSGHKRSYSVNWQAVVTLDGLISSLRGPFPGIANDWGMWQRSNITEDLRRVLAGQQMLYLYGDPVYSYRFGITYPFKHPQGRRALSKA